MICPSCGRENPEGQRFCGNCGHRLDQPKAAEVRKTVTIVFSDVAGSTALGEQLDPEALRRVMSRYFDVMRAILQSHGGTVEKFIGDAVMAVFGIPAVHEDDALRAARAAAEMREALEDLNRGARARPRRVDLEPDRCEHRRGRRGDYLDLYDLALVRVLEEHSIDYVVVAGFPRIIGTETVHAYPDRIVKVHHSLLPEFPGLDPVTDALEHGVKQTGVTVHLINRELEVGPIVSQQALEIHDGET